jgi:hypothetical protein
MESAESRRRRNDKQNKKGEKRREKRRERETSTAVLFVQP